MILYIIKEVREELGIKLETLSKLSGIHAIESVTMKVYIKLKILYHINDFKSRLFKICI